MRFAPLVHRVWENLRRHEMTSRNDRILLAVSGGVDSMVLWRALTELAPANGWTLGVGHVDHGLRADSAATADWLEREARERGVPFQSVHLDGEALRADPSGLEAAARREREAALELMAEDWGAARIATAHHRDDQAETVLERLTRGAGRAGLAGIRPVRGRWIRPLLEIGREEIVAFARSEHLAWREDDSNTDRRFFRNVLRHDILPALRAARPGSDRVLARVAETARVEDAVLDEFFREEMIRRASGDGGAGAFDAQGLDSRSEEYRTWMAHRLLREMDGARVARADILALSVLFEETAIGRVIDVGGGMTVVRTRSGIEWRRVTAPAPFEIRLDVPGEVPLGEGSRLIARPGHSGDDGQRGPTFGIVNPLGIDGPMRVRNRRPGDRVRRLGLGGAKTLADCWSESGVAADRRSRLPVVCDERGVIWAPWAGPDSRVSAYAQLGDSWVLDYQDISITDR